MFICILWLSTVISWHPFDSVAPQNYHLHLSGKWQDAMMRGEAVGWNTGGDVNENRSEPIITKFRSTMRFMADHVTSITILCKQRVFTCIARRVQSREKFSESWEESRVVNILRCREYLGVANFSESWVSRSCEDSDSWLSQRSPKRCSRYSRYSRYNLTEISSFIYP